MSVSAPRVRVRNNGLIAMNIAAKNPAVSFMSLLPMKNAEIVAMTASSVGR